MSTSSPGPAQQDKGQFLAATRAFCHLIYQANSLAEVKAATFLFENTYCYMEFDGSKRITLDEFVHGRKKKDGTRLSTGCGISRRNHASEALNRLEHKGTVTVLTDEHDLARKRKFYRLTLPSLEKCSENGNTDAIGVPKTGTLDTFPVPNLGTSEAQTVPELGTPDSLEDAGCSENGNIVFLNREHSVPESGTLGSQIGNSIRVSTLVSTKESAEVSTSYVEAPKTVDVAPIGASADAQKAAVRRKKDGIAPALSLPAKVSDSQAVQNAPAPSRLHEGSPAENADIAYYRQQLRDAQRELQREQEYADTCDPRDKPAVERRIAALKSSVDYFEQLVIKMAPKPPLTDKNWQSQLVGALCETFEVPTKEMSGTDLAGQIGKAANILKRFHRRPEEVPSLYVEFRRKYAWKKGRSLGGLILDFANSAAVLNG